VWLGILVLLVSVVVPVMELSMATAASAQPTASACPAGQVADPRRGCIQPIVVPGQDCPAGQVVDPEGGCIADAAEPPPPTTPVCPKGQVFDPRRQVCISTVPILPPTAVPTQRPAAVPTLPPTAVPTGVLAQDPVVIEVQRRVCPATVNVRSLGVTDLIRQCPQAVAR
jgi:hypothetical protein